MRRAWPLPPLLLAWVLAGCGPSAAPPVQPRYVLGPAYEAGGVWYYPHASYNADDTGLAGVLPADHPPLTADGEAYDPTALAAAHQTLQLPAIARVTNLENGRQLVLRLNDRGPATPARLIAVTPRTAELLGFADAGVGRVRLEVLGRESHGVADALAGAGEPRIAIETAPRGDIQQADLAPPAGAAQAVRRQAASDGPVAAGVPGDAVTATVPNRLPETVVQGLARPGSLYIRLGSFGRRQFAERQAARIAGAGPRIERTRVGRSETYRVIIGPLAGVAEADRTLDAVIRAGIPDARIVVEQE